jgi:hypothetical protein
MEYRGFRYEIRRALGRNQWVWTVSIPEPKSGKVVGDRTYATLRAKRVIDILCRADSAPERRGRRAENVIPPPDSEFTTLVAKIEK